MNQRKTILRHRRKGDSHTVDATLRVLIYKSDGHYVAQSLEIDYLSTGETEDAAKNNFAEGLIRTIQANLQRDRSLRGLFKSRTPPDCWLKYMNSRRQNELYCSLLLSLEDKLPVESGFPFASLAYCRLPESATA